MAQQTFSVTVDGTSLKLNLYTDLFIRSFGKDTAGMSTNDKIDFVEQRMFKYLKERTKAQSDFEIKSAAALEDVEANITQV